jgi:hypothetical protein
VSALCLHSRKVHVPKELKVDVCECSKVHQVIRIRLKELKVHASALGA